MYSTFGSSRLPVICVVSSWMLSCALPAAALVLGAVFVRPVTEASGRAVPGAAAVAATSGFAEGSGLADVSDVEEVSAFPGLGAFEEPVAVAAEGVRSDPGVPEDSVDGCIADVLTPGSRSPGRGVL